MSFVMYNWVSILIPFFIGLFRYKDLDKSLRLFFYFVVYGTINEIAVRLFIYMGGNNTMLSSHLYVMLEFFMLGLFYSEVLKGIIRKRIIIAIIVLFELYCVINVLFLQSVHLYPSIPLSVSKIFFVGFSLLFLYKVMTEAIVQDLWKEPLIYINFSVLIYYSGNLFYALLFNIILEHSRELSKEVGYYYTVLNTIFYILIAIGFWKAGRKPATVEKKLL
ncbi:hypothetical protein SLH46_17080 [Draconibacterium sp. IB214405]|uniref:hypothetical protein n=1 Tax=Draconibacterium sp. IB214405 TaxID=3097352 RepID=UPI002A0ED467|nr:hypothetical protein [Draconibacterium sp. IB214405]MDX8340915.1 hypothetical protein [Draconibacterium sp. IB214405]